MLAFIPSFCELLPIIVRQTSYRSALCSGALFGLIAIVLGEHVRAGKKPGRKLAIAGIYMGLLGMAIDVAMNLSMVLAG